jgi:hypothetical protein
MQKSKPFPKEPEPKPPRPGPSSKPTGVAPRVPRPNPAAAQSPVEIKWKDGNAKLDTKETTAIENAIMNELFPKITATIISYVSLICYLPTHLQRLEDSGASVLLFVRGTSLTNSTPCRRHQYKLTNSGNEAAWVVNITGNPQPRIYQIVFTYSLDEGKIVKMDIHRNK